MQHYSLFQSFNNPFLIQFHTEQLFQGFIICMIINCYFSLKTCRKSDKNCPTNVQAGFSILLDLFSQGDIGTYFFEWDNHMNSVIQYSFLHLEWISKIMIHLIFSTDFIDKRKLWIFEIEEMTWTQQVSFTV